AKIAEADVACPAESGSSAALATTIRAMLAPADASKGTEATARAKMHEAFAAERTDRARAKTLYLDAWAEQHPNPRALEDAARNADGVEARRLRDRALAEAEAIDKTTPVVTSRVHPSRGAARLFGSTLLVGADGKVAAFDTKTNDMRVMVDSPTNGARTQMRISPAGTLAVSAGWPPPSNATVFDVLTGAPLFKINSVRKIAIAPDDSAIAVIDDRDGPDSQQFARVLDVATGQVKSKLSGKWRSQFIAFAPDAKHVIVFGDDQDSVIRQWDVEKNAYTSLRLDSLYGQAGTSSDGHYLAYLETSIDPAPLHVRDMLTNKDIAKWEGSFHSVEAFGITNDGKTIATGSRNSLRLWDVAQKKQLFKHDSSNGGAATNDADDFAFDDEGKTMLLGGGNPTAWDVATGKETLLVPYQREENVLHVVKSPDGVAVILEDEVRLVPKTGEPRTVCKGMLQPYAPVIGPTNIAFSPSGKTFACGMSDGWVHVFDTSTWAETTVVKRGAESPIERPVDLVLDDASLTIVANGGFVSYDAKTAKETRRVTFKAPMPLAPRHGRTDDGTIAVRTWTGSLAIFDKDGVYQREVKLGMNPAIGALDAFSSDGKTYAAVVGKTLHAIDLATGEDHPSDLATLKPKSIAFVSGKPIASADRVSIIGNTLYTASGGTIATPAVTLEIVADGLIARDATGAFEVRGKPLAACVVGQKIATWLTTETCADYAKDTLVASFTEQKTGT
ncbi:MAG TPA: WD40 repeat domain-containing protein, partial [Polyangiaceae bacterium]|nr:WD40 repeat domain-containing protein [Polyangiaceae bacterium]